jgi:hypothetical protein
MLFEFATLPEGLSAAAEFAEEQGGCLGWSSHGNGDTSDDFMCSFSLLSLPYARGGGSHWVHWELVKGPCSASETLPNTAR